VAHDAWRVNCVGKRMVWCINREQRREQSRVASKNKNTRREDLLQMGTVPSEVFIKDMSQNVKVLLAEIPSSNSTF
jgi:hypothetical protein